MTQDRLAATISDFDAQNAGDPRQITVDGAVRPQELLDAERLSAWVSKLAPDASVALRLAAHCQHLRRWESPRSSYPEGRAGYLKWRADLQRIHADHAVETLRAHRWDEPTIDAVRRIIEKRGGPDTTLMEDALCLAFLEHESEQFASKHPDDKMVRVLTKTWRKMSPRARQAALGLSLTPRVAALVSRAIGEPVDDDEPA